MPKLNKTQAKALPGKAIEIYWDGEELWFEAEALTAWTMPLLAGRDHSSPQRGLLLRGRFLLPGCSPRPAGAVEPPTSVARIRQRVQSVQFSSARAACHQAGPKLPISLCV